MMANITFAELRTLRLKNEKFIIKRIQSPELHGAVVNVPVDVNKTYYLFATSEHVIMVRTKNIVNVYVKEHVF